MTKAANSRKQKEEYEAIAAFLASTAIAIGIGFYTTLIALIDICTAGGATNEDDRNRKRSTRSLPPSWSPLRSSERLDELINVAETCLDEQHIEESSSFFQDPQRSHGVGERYR